MTVWHWVRHGPTHQKNLVGWRDVPADLSDTAQIARLIDHLPQTAHVISSDLVRASATADVLTSAGHIRLPHDPNLREFNFGSWDGLHFSDVAKRDPELSRAYWEQPGDIAPPEGESWNMAATRVNATVDALNTAHPNGHIIAVAHIGVILTQVQRGLGVEAYAALGHSIDNLSVTRIVWEDGAARVETINHLP